MNRLRFLYIVSGMLLMHTIGFTQITVTFRLNTSTIYSNDVTDSSLVQVRGSLFPLSWDNTSVDLTNVDGDYWETSIEFDSSLVGETLSYKYYADDWESGYNKTLVLTEDVVLEQAYFDNDYTPPFTPSARTDLWFRVNMESCELIKPNIHNS